MKPAFSPLAEAFADQCRRWAGNAPPEARQAVARAARALVEATLAGHTCLIRSERPATASDAALLASGLVGTDVACGLPLVLTPANGHLYLARHAAAEARLAHALLRRAEAGALRLFCGGPGTGKTTRVAQLLATALAATPALRVALAAPTGKAAARLIESLTLQAATLDPETAARLPRHASTLHRLLGLRPGARLPRHHRDHPLPLDLLIVDEASMLDLSLADRLLDALPPQATLILLGDPDQLAAVESGAVLAELCQSAHPAMTEALTRLTVSYRFGAETPLGQLAAAIRDQRGEAALACLGAVPPLRLLPDAENDERLIEGYAPYFAALKACSRDETAVAERWAAFNRFRLLAVHRQGARGCEGLNRLLDSVARDRAARIAGMAYDGRPIIVRENAPALRLFNGDIGLMLDTPAGLQTFFPEGDHFRSIARARLPLHESAWALTVHQSQGSEWPEVALVLPTSDSPLLTRELAYTAVTRARTTVTILGNREQLLSAILRPSIRHSGLAERLRPSHAETANPPEACA